MNAVPAKENVLRGALFLALCAMCYALTGVLVRLASHEFDNNNLVFWRNLTGLMCLLPWLARAGLGALKTQKFGWHFARTAVGLTAMYLYFYCLANFTLAEAMIFVYSAPVVVPVLAVLLIKEPITRRIYIAVLVGLAGVVCVVKPGTEHFIAMAPAGLACTLYTALAFVCVRKLSATEPAMRVVFYFTFLSTLISLFPFLFNPQLPSGKMWLILAGIGAVNTLAQWFMSKAYGYAPAGKIAPVSYLTVLIAGIFGWLFWNEMPDAYAIGGAILIFSSALLVVKLNRPA